MKSKGLLLLLSAMVVAIVGVSEISAQDDGTWVIGSKYPERFARLLPITGYRPLHRAELRVQGIGGDRVMMLL